MKHQQYPRRNSVFVLKKATNYRPKFGWQKPTWGNSSLKMVKRQMHSGQYQQAFCSSYDTGRAIRREKRFHIVASGQKSAAMLIQAGRNAISTFSVRGGAPQLFGHQCSARPCAGNQVGAVLIFRPHTSLPSKHQLLLVLPP